jgi:putative FmdB family regulatory protein
VPIYEYRCPNGHTFEVFQKMTDPPVDACTVCRASPVEKILFPVAVHFKGSGFYSTDYGRAGKKAARDSDGAGPADKGAEKAAKPAEKASGGEKKTASDS